MRSFAGNRRRIVLQPQIEVRDSGAQTPALDRALALLEFVSAHSEGVTQADIRNGMGFSANLVFRSPKPCGPATWSVRSRAHGSF